MGKPISNLFKENWFFLGSKNGKTGLLLHGFPSNNIINLSSLVNILKGLGVILMLLLHEING